MSDFENYLKKTGEIGFVRSMGESIIYVEGLPNITPSEIVAFETGDFGQVLFLNSQNVEVLLFSEKKIPIGTRVARTGEKLEIPLGEELLGWTIDPLGAPLEKKEEFKKPRKKGSLETSLWGIEKRSPINKPLETGISLVDVLVPLGKGQRELIIGDRNTGKTSVVLQSLVFQAKKGVICVYAAIGKKKTELKEIEELFENEGIKSQTVIVASCADESTGLIYLAPFSAMTIAEYFRDQGKDVLVVFDDLTTHARFYRQIALLARRFPGRDSYPVDIFFTHARLMERGGNFLIKEKEVSISILPIADTVRGNLSGYVQTNLMAMTDGHIYFDRDLFVKGRRPAINPFLSVTRVGRQAQTPLTRGMSREIVSYLSLYEKVQGFIHFGTEVHEDTKTVINKGERLTSFFDQDSKHVMPPNLTVFLLGLLWQGYGADQELDDLKNDLDGKTQAYFEDQVFQKKVDELVSESKDFKDFLKNMEEKVKF